MKSGAWSPIAGIAASVDGVGGRAGVGLLLAVGLGSDVDSVDGVTSGVLLSTRAKL